MVRHVSALALLGLLATLPALAAELVIYPKKGQTEEQQTQDKLGCQDWATKQTGFDPMNPEAAAAGIAAAPAAAKSETNAVRGAARGAVIGAAAGAVAGDAGKGAGVGAAAGAATGAIRKRSGERTAESEAQAVDAQKQQAIANAKAGFTTAYKTCLEGRDYSVN